MKLISIKPQHSYVIGYVLSLILTIYAFVTVSTHTGPLAPPLITMLSVLASAQILVHLFYFLHLGHETKPRWNSVAFVMSVMVLLFIVIGSIWVMNNLDYNMMTPEAQQSIIDDEGLQPSP